MFGTVLQGFKSSASAVGLSEEAYLSYAVLKAQTGDATALTAIKDAATGADQTFLEGVLTAAAAIAGL